MLGGNTVQASFDGSVVGGGRHNVHSLHFVHVPIEECVSNSGADDVGVHVLLCEAMQHQSEIPREFSCPGVVVVEMQGRVLLQGCVLFLLIGLKRVPAD